MSRGPESLSESLPATPGAVRISRPQALKKPSRNHPIGPESRLLTLAKLDKRSKPAWLMERVRQNLTEHVGGNPSFVQRMLIERAAVLTLRLALADQRIIDGEVLPLHADQWLCAWQNALTRTLVALGVKPEAAAQPLRLDDYVKARTSYDRG